MNRCIGRVSKMLLMFSLALSFGVKAETVDLMVLYDDYSEQRLGGSPKTSFINWVDEANGFYRNSKIDIQLRLVGTLKYNISGSDMGSVLERYRADAWVREQRAALGADVVTYVHESGNCGVGFFSVHRDWAYNVIGTGGCGGAMVMAHEIGHNMGLAHSRFQGDTGGVRYAYGLGHGKQNSFGTIMSYAYLFNGDWKPVFSNPNIDCDGDPCGVPEGQAEQADAAKALNNVSREVAGFVATKVADAGVVADGIYAIMPVHSGKCIDVNGARTSANEQLIQWECHYHSNQQWKFARKNSNNYEIRAMHSGLCMTVPQGSKSNGVVIRQEQCSGGDDQLWSITEAEGGSYSIQNVASGKSLDINGASKDNHADVIQWSYWNGANQRFNLDPQ